MQYETWYNIFSISCLAISWFVYNHEMSTVIQYLYFQTSSLSYKVTIENIYLSFKSQISKIWKENNCLYFYVVGNKLWNFFDWYFPPDEWFCTHLNRSRNLRVYLYISKYIFYIQKKKSVKSIIVITFLFVLLHFWCMAMWWWLVTCTLRI